MLSRHFNSLQIKLKSALKRALTAGLTENQSNSGRHVTFLEGTDDLSSDILEKSITIALLMIKLCQYPLKSALSSGLKPNYTLHKQVFRIEALPYSFNSSRSLNKKRLKKHSQRVKTLRNACLIRFGSQFKSVVL